MITVAGFFILSLIVTIAGVLTPLSAQDSEELSKELRQTQQEMKQMDIFHSAVAIFRNNFLISLIMFVPVVGPFFGIYVLHNTGVIIAAESISNQAPALPVFLILFIFPFTWMEFLAYSIALSESVWLTRRIIQKKAQHELTRTVILILVVGATLLAAAFIESALIAWLT
jgi:hypothetical protein